MIFQPLIIHNVSTCSILESSSIIHVNNRLLATHSQLQHYYDLQLLIAKMDEHSYSYCPVETIYAGPYSRLGEVEESNLQAAGGETEA